MGEGFPQHAAQSSLGALGLYAWSRQEAYLLRLAPGRGALTNGR